MFPDKGICLKVACSLWEHHSERRTHLSVDIPEFGVDVGFTWSSKSVPKKAAIPPRFVESRLVNTPDAKERLARTREFEATS